MMTSKSNRITAKQEENIISTICGDTTSFQRTVSANWVALASGTRSVEKVEEIVKKYGGKVVNGEIKLDSLRGSGKIGVAYGEIRNKRAKELEAYHKKKMKANKKGLTRKRSK